MNNILFVLLLIVLVVLFIKCRGRSHTEGLRYLSQYDDQNHIEKNPYIYPVPYSATTAYFDIERGYA